jgi:uncharacterized protein DUF499
VPIPTIKQLCKGSSAVTSDGLVEQVAQVEKFDEVVRDAREFFRRNHFTDGLNRLIEQGFARLAGRSEQGSFYLTQAMGGGKTHSLLAFGLLAADPKLRKEVLSGSQANTDFGPAKVVIFSGLQSPENLLWGHIAEKAGRPEPMERFWRNGPRTPGVNEWAAVLGDKPILVLLDELPSYLQMAQGEPVGNTTLGDLTIGALERLFNALDRCPRACVVVTNLKDDVYLDGSGQLKTLIESLSKHYDRNATAITPVQQNTSEVFEIVRKRLFDKLPSPEQINEVAKAYVKALQKAKRVDTIPSTPETFIERIRETYPFHPSIRDIVARFAENRGYQKTRALIRLLRLAVRGALASKNDVYLIGLQHLDFHDQATLEELRKINQNYMNAISHDIASRGDALAEKIDKMDGNTTASSVAKMLLMSSLSTAETPLRGLTEGELIETLVDPVLEVSAIKTALGRLQGQAWYLFQGVDQRIYFGQTANVTAEITETANNIAPEHVDQALRDKLKEVFKPRTGNLYSDKMAILPGLDEIELDDDRPTLVILERPADKLPDDFDQWWKKQDEQNRVLVLTADPNACSTLRMCARRMKAIEVVKKGLKARHGDASPQMDELREVEGRETISFTSALRETFKTIVFPIGDRLRKVDDFRMEFDRNDYSGEQQIIDTLSKRGKYIPADKFDELFETLRVDAEEILFDADAVQRSSLKRNAAARSKWYWLPRNGLDEIIKTARQRGYWDESQGLVAKKWEKRTKVEARLDDYAPNPLETGRFTINVTPEDADIVYYSEEGSPDPATAKKLDGRVLETEAAAVWFLALDSSGKNKTGDVCEWRAPVRVKPNIVRKAGGHVVTFLVCPRAATIHATLDGSDPARVAPLAGLAMDAPQGATRLRVVARLGDQVSDEESAPLDGMSETGPRIGEQTPQPLKPDVPATLTSRIEINDTALAFTALDRLAKTRDAAIFGGWAEAKGGRAENDYLSLRLGRDVGIAGAELDALAKTLVERLKADSPKLNLRLDSVSFPSGRELQDFCDLVGEDFGRVTWKQE